MNERAHWEVPYLSGFFSFVFVGLKHHHCQRGAGMGDLFFVLSCFYLRCVLWKYRVCMCASVCTQFSFF